MDINLDEWTSMGTLLRGLTRFIRSCWSKVPWVLAICYYIIMNTEIEVKFINIDHDKIRSRLQELGATLEQPMRVMRRVVIHTPDMTAKNAFLRIRD